MTDLKHIKSFEQYSVDFIDEIVNEEFLNLFNTIKTLVEKIPTITNDTSDDDVKKIFFDLFDKLSTQTNFSVNAWKTIKEFLNKGKISRETMVSLLNEAKNEYDKTKKIGYLTITQGKITYKKAESISTRSGFAGGVGGGS